MEAVLAIARHGSFRAAALDRGMSTTTLSHTIGRLEADLGGRLFNQTARSVSLTDTGRDFVGRKSPAVAEIRAAMDAARSQRETPSDLLRINASVQGARQIAPLMLEFLRRYPEVQVDLVTEGRLVDIVGEGYDLGIRPADLERRDTIALPLGQPQRYAVVPAPTWLKTHTAPMSPADLPAQECIRVYLPNGALFRWQFERDGEVMQFEAKGRLTLDDASIARAAVLDGVGVGFFIEQDVVDDISRGHLIHLLEDWTPPRAGFCLYYPGRRNPSDGFAAFLALARSMATRHLQSG
ncbi:MAG: LysR family transcriptional regulator [Roseovarius sp. BRH_c41]|nr:MAG: LysR family transcriptional regulator [Roseovarius sp. BRH_c41]